jgi:hypothetical protein
MLAWFVEHSEVAASSAKLDILELAVHAATHVASAVCTMRGANLPHGFNRSREERAALS